ncbi:MAG: hypothetical protein ACR2NU_00995 [Aeoliella sp.]
MNIYQTLAATLLAALSLSTLTGCGRSSDLDKVTVEGTVSYDGTPVKNGEIRFHPVEGTKGPVSGAPIVDGSYRAVAKGGVPVGKQLVRIEAYDVSGGGGGGGDMISGAGTGSRVNYIPAKYHRESELVIEVTGDRSTMTKDFALEK